jgi:hypothetical protein
MMRREIVLCLLALALFSARAQAVNWITIAPNPAYSRDLAMGSSTVALSYAPQSQSINPAGLSLFNTRTALRASVIVNPGGLWQIRNYTLHSAAGRPALEQAWDVTRLAVGTVALQSYIVRVAAAFSQPVMDATDSTRYSDFRNGTSLDYHQNSLLVSLALHPRVSIGGRVDRYYRFDAPEGDAYCYGVILRPKNVSVGVQYQRFPASGARLWHPLDRRADQTTTAGVAMEQRNFTFTFQVMNLTQKDASAFLEPHTGVEWRPVPAIALRAGGMIFSRTARWAWTGGLSLLDANALHNRLLRLIVPDEVLQVAVGVTYHHRTPVAGVSSLTCAWRF